jgi:uncharacterized protein (DUF1697 family)
MKTYIILLRGVMPTGKNRVPMAQLRQVLTDAGFVNVRTWIQSGNIVLQTELPEDELERQVHNLILEHIGADLAVVVRTAEQIEKLLYENPFTEGYDISRVFFVSFHRNPAREKIDELLKTDFSPEELVIREITAYMYIPGTYGKQKLQNNFLEKKLGVSATTRNFNTLTKMLAMSNEG